MKTLKLFHPYTETTLTNPGSIVRLGKLTEDGDYCIVVHRNRHKPRVLEYRSAGERDYDYDRIKFWVDDYLNNRR